MRFYRSVATQICSFRNVKLASLSKLFGIITTIEFYCQLAITTMLLKKYRRKQRNLTKILVFNKGEVILYKQQITRQVYTLIQGAAYIQSRSQGADHIHCFNKDDILNQVQCRNHIPMLKTVRCATKCKVQASEIQPPHSTHKKTPDQHKLDHFLSRFVGNRYKAEEITSYAEEVEGKQDTCRLVESGLLYLLTRGELEFKGQRQKQGFRRMFNKQVCPIVGNPAHTRNFQFVVDSHFFVLRLDLLKHFMEKQQIKALEAAIQDYSPSQNQPLRKISNSFIQRNKKNNSFILRKPRLDTRSNSSLNKTELIKQNCLAHQYFMFSVKCKLQQQSKNVSPANYRANRANSTQNRRLVKAMNLSLCCYHKQLCPHNLSREQFFYSIQSSPKKQKICASDQY